MRSFSLKQTSNGETAPPAVRRREFRVCGTDGGGSVGGERESDGRPSVSDAEFSATSTGIAGTRAQDTGITQQALGPHRAACSLTQLLAVLRRRRRQARDPTGVTPEVLVLCCRGNVPHFHCRVAAKGRGGEGERM